MLAHWQPQNVVVRGKGKHETTGVMTDGVLGHQLQGVLLVGVFQSHALLLPVEQELGQNGGDSDNADSNGDGQGLKSNDKAVIYLTDCIETAQVTLELMTKNETRTN